MSRHDEVERRQNVYRKAERKDPARVSNDIGERASQEVIAADVGDATAGSCVPPVATTLFVETAESAVEDSGAGADTTAVAAEPVGTTSDERYVRIYLTSQYASA